MRPDWERGLRGRLYALGRRAVPLSWRRALRRRFPVERLLGLRKPPTDLPRFPIEEAARPGRPDVLVLPVIAWTYRRQRPQQLAEALARRGRRVFYGSLEGEGEPEEPAGVAPGVVLLPIPGVRREDPADRRLGNASRERALSGIEAARARFGMRDGVVLVQSPFWTPLALALRTRFGWSVAYDCLDAHEAFDKNRPGVLAGPEREIAAAADLVTATSEPLRRRLEESGAAARLLPNACDFALFERVPPPHPRAERLTVGYVGAVDEWLDLPLVAAVAARRPLWRFEMVGGVDDAAGPLPRGENLVFRGERPHAEMPEWRARFDVEIIPFRLSALTHATDPVKLYEAAAAGRPVVATPMESLRSLAARGIVRLAGSAEDLEREIAAAAAAAADEAPGLRAFAQENTWDRRAAALDEWLTGVGARGNVGVSREP
ncbi:MAG: glycosyltransferase [Syntrophomonadaceae bacterium]